MPHTRRALRTPLCAAIARRIRAGVWLTSWASWSCAVWATSSAPPLPRPAPVETARFNPVPFGPVKAEPALPARARTFDRPSPTPAAPARASAPAAMSGDAGAALARVRLTRDNGAAPFIIVDKRNARMWLFDAHGQARGNSAVLLGRARGDDTVPGIGDKPLARIRVGERTTPAGRFVAEPGRNARGDDIFWVDYEAAVSMHRVHEVDRGERRLQRLASASVADNRISYGCINVPTAFYDRTLLPLVGGKRPVVYVLPETRPLDTLFKPSTGALVARAARPTGKGPSWRPSTNAVSESSDPSTTW
jgi:hypothetical protein